MPLDISPEVEKVWGWERHVGDDERQERFDPDPRESPFELQPIEGAPFADANERARAICRIVEQAEQERAAAP